jgi:hypothetical protein
LGRWLTKDPIEEKGGLNLYCFCINNVAGNIDYLGKLANVKELYRQVESVIKSLGARAARALATADKVLKRVNASGAAVEGAVVLPLANAIVGANAMFFPDSCEIGSYKYFSGMLAAIFNVIEEKDKPDFIENPFELLRGFSWGNVVGASVTNVIGIPVGGGDHDSTTWLGWFWNGELSIPTPVPAVGIAGSAFGGLPVGNGTNKWYGAALGIGVGPSGASVGVSATYYKYLWGEKR